MSNRKVVLTQQQQSIKNPSLYTQQTNDDDDAFPISTKSIQSLLYPLQDVDIDKKFIGLRNCNCFLAGLHFANAFIVFLLILLNLSSQKFVPVTTTKLAGRPGYGNYTYGNVVYEINPQWLSFAFALICFFAHTAYYAWPESYEKLIRAQNNWWRWLEYGFSASLMIVQISLLTGITDLSAQINAFGTVFATIWLGQFTEEKYPADERKKRWFAFAISSVVVLFPWVSIFTTFGLSGANPGILVTLIVAGQIFMFTCFAFVSALNIYYLIPNTGNDLKIEEKNVKTYIRGEFYYNLLSFLAKTYLIWMTYGANA